jgi:predicted DNA-binding transcriptional regulator AlpA
VTDDRFQFSSISPLLSVAHVAAFLGTSARGVYNRLHRGSDFPPPIRIGSSLRWRVEDITAWLDDHRDVEVGQ